MPHDLTGRSLKKGDLIIIPAIIDSLQPGSDACNINVVVLHPFSDGTTRQSFSYLNTAQVELRTPAEIIDIGRTMDTAPAIGSGQKRSLARDLQITEDKNLRVQIDGLIAIIHGSPFESAERTHAYDALRLAKAWLGFDLQELGTPNPYPNSRNTSNVTVDPTADTAQAAKGQSDGSLEKYLATEAFSLFADGGAEVPPLEIAKRLVAEARAARRGLTEITSGDPKAGERTNGFPLEAVEARAREIYDQMRQGDPEGEKTPWVDGGNSLKQQEARTEAIKRLTEESGQTQAGG